MDSFLDQFNATISTRRDSNESIETLFKQIEEQEKTYYIVCLDFFASCWGERKASNSEIIGKFC